MWARMTNCVFPLCGPFRTVIPSTGSGQALSPAGEGSSAKAQVLDSASWLFYEDHGRKAGVSAIKHEAPRQGLRPFRPRMTDVESVEPLSLSNLYK